MSEFERRLSGISGDRAPRGAEDARWQSIRELSVRGFVVKVAKALGGENDRGLREQLYRSALRDGETVTWGRVDYTPIMQLGMYRQHEDIT